MKKILMILVILVTTSVAFAQKKDSVAMSIEVFDKNRNGYEYVKKYDHIPTRNDSISFNIESSIAINKMIDSAELMKKKIKPKKTKSVDAN